MLLWTHRCFPSAGRVKPERSLNLLLSCEDLPARQEPRQLLGERLYSGPWTTWRTHSWLPSSPLLTRWPRAGYLTMCSTTLANFWHTNSASHSNSEVWPLAGCPQLFRSPTHLLSTIYSCALPLVQDLNWSSMKQKQLHDKDVLFCHSLVQCCVAFIVRNVNGGPMLESETVQSKGMLKAINSESRWCIYRCLI